MNHHTMCCNTSLGLVTTWLRQGKEKMNHETNKVKNRLKHTRGMKGKHFLNKINELPLWELEVLECHEFL